MLVGSRGGPELALQSTQAAQESDASHVTLHLDVTDAYPSVDRGLMLQSIYGDPRLQHLWRSFDFAFSEPAVILVHSGEEVIHTAVSDNGVPQGNVLSSLAYARVVQQSMKPLSQGWTLRPRLRWMILPPQGRYQTSSRFTTA